MFVHAIARVETPIIYKNGFKTWAIGNDLVTVKNTFWKGELQVSRLL